MIRYTSVQERDIGRANHDYAKKYTFDEQPQRTARELLSCLHSSLTSERRVKNDNLNYLLYYILVFLNG